MIKLEALADAIAQLQGYGDPESISYQSRNPGLLKDSLTKEVRVFSSLIGGYRALLDNLDKKCQGRSRSRVTAESSIGELLATFGFHEEQISTMVVSFLRAALHEPVEQSTRLKFFTE